MTDACTGCGVCVDDVCFVDAIRLKDGKATISDECRGCGRCVEVCPQNAITLSIDNDDFVDLTVRKLEQIVDTE
ncbi:MAG: 4Fe-4S dicluster domain-containing protein [Candidatus Thorarchaeota archaeon]|nr:4Fe-4S dicluster domain-containing protein [Candidatus Thorarchaeota archaeon]